MEIGRLQGILQSEIDDAIGMLDSETTQERGQAIDYYLRKPYGNEIEGRRQIVTGEVAEVVDGALPQLIRVFTSSDELGRFEPVGPGDEEGAKQATDYANWVFYKDNRGFALLHDWFKDALLEKTGTLKAYWEQTIDVNEEAYRGLTDTELLLLMSDGTRQIVAQETITEEVQTPAGVISGGTTHNVVVQKRETSGRIQIDVVPPEEIIVSKKATCVDDAPFIGHRTLKPRSDLIAMEIGRAHV